MKAGLAVMDAGRWVRMDPSGIWSVDRAFPMEL
jgi:hypothetical protein